IQVRAISAYNACLAVRVTAHCRLLTCRIPTPHGRSSGQSAWHSSCPASSRMYLIRTLLSGNQLPPKENSYAFRNQNSDGDSVDHCALLSGPCPGAEDEKGAEQQGR